MLKRKNGGAEGSNGFQEVVLTSPTHTDDRKKKTRRFPDLPAADNLGIGCVTLASLSFLPGQLAAPVPAMQRSLPPPAHPLGQHLSGDGAEAAWLGDARRPPQHRDLDLHLCHEALVCRVHNVQT